MPRTQQTTKRAAVSAGKHGGKRHHYRGKTVREDGSPRAHTHGGHSQADKGFMAGDTATSAHPTSSKALSRFVVSAPTKRHHRRGIVRNATTGEQV